jgi:hypothetical protein
LFVKHNVDVTAQVKDGNASDRGGEMWILRGSSLSMVVMPHWHLRTSTGQAWVDHYIGQHSQGRVELAHFFVEQRQRNGPVKRWVEGGMFQFS